MSNKAKSMVAWKMIFWSLLIFYIIALLVVFSGLLGPIIRNGGKRIEGKIQDGGSLGATS
jgi:uncharacterized protein YpmS